MLAANSISWLISQVEGDLRLHAGQGSAQAVVNAVAEGDVAAGVTVGNHGLIRPLSNGVGS